MLIVAIGMGCRHGCSSADGRHEWRAAGFVALIILLVGASSFVALTAPDIWCIDRRDGRTSAARGYGTSRCANCLGRVSVEHILSVVLMSGVLFAGMGMPPPQSVAPPNPQGSMGGAPPGE